MAKKEKKSTARDKTARRRKVVYAGHIPLKHKTEVLRTAGYIVSCPSG